MTPSHKIVAFRFGTEEFLLRNGVEVSQALWQKNWTMPKIQSFVDILVHSGVNLEHHFGRDSKTLKIFDFVSFLVVFFSQLIRPKNLV